MMKNKLLILALFSVVSCSNSPLDAADVKPAQDTTRTETQADGTLIADGKNAGTYALVRSKGYNYETPDSSRNHKDSHFQHIQQVYDGDLGKYVFSFIIHADVDDDRGRADVTDRQRNEIKTDNKSPKSMVAQEGETLVLKWKFKLPERFRTTTKFSHLHQLKGIDNTGGTADVSIPLVTLTAYSDSKGAQKLKLRYDKRGEGTTTLAAVGLENFLGNWVSVVETARFGVAGSYSVVITRVSDGTVLLQYEQDGLDMWRTGSEGLRPKWGIYRYIGENRSWQDKLRDEEIRFADFSVTKTD